MPEQPDPDHQRPAPADDATVAAAGKVSEFFEWVVRARGRLYDFHQMVGHANGILGKAVEDLEAAGHEDLAHRLRTELLGRNVLPDQWTFEIVEAFDAGYWRHAVEAEQLVRDALMAGRRHVFEAEMKADRRRDGPTDDR